MKLTIAQIDKVLWQGNVTSITVPAIEGEMTILPHHVPLITLLKKGTIRVVSLEGKETFAIEKGFLEIGTTETIILV